MSFHVFSLFERAQVLLKMKEPSLALRDAKMAGIRHTTDLVMYNSIMKFTNMFYCFLKIVPQFPVYCGPLISKKHVTVGENNKTNYQRSGGLRIHVAQQKSLV